MIAELHRPPRRLLITKLAVEEGFWFQDDGGAMLAFDCA